MQKRRGRAPGRVKPSSSFNRPTTHRIFAANSVPVGLIKCKFDGTILDIDDGVIRILAATDHPIDPKVHQVSMVDAEELRRRFVNNTIGLLLPESMRSMHSRLLKKATKCPFSAAPHASILHSGVATPCVMPARTDSSMRILRLVRMDGVSFIDVHVKVEWNAPRAALPRRSRPSPPGSFNLMDTPLVSIPGKTSSTTPIGTPVTDKDWAVTVTLTPMGGLLRTQRGLLETFLPRNFAQSFRLAPDNWLEPSIRRRISYNVWAAIMFLDICGSTEYATTHTDAETEGMTTTLFDLIDDVVACFSNKIHKLELIGDAFVAVSMRATNPDTAADLMGEENKCASCKTGKCTWKSCAAHRCKVLRAIECRNMARCALQITRAIARAKTKIDILRDVNIRIGLNCGPARCSTFERSGALHFYGISFPATARLESHATPGSILMPEEMLQRIEDADADKAVASNRTTSTVQPRTTANIFDDDIDPFEHEAKASGGREGLSSEKPWKMTAKGLPPIFVVGVTPEQNDPSTGNPTPGGRSSSTSISNATGGDAPRIRITDLSTLETVFNPAAVAATAAAADTTPVPSGGGERQLRRGFSMRLEMTQTVESSDDEREDGEGGAKQRKAAAAKAAAALLMDPKGGEAIRPQDSNCALASALPRVASVLTIGMRRASDNTSAKAASSTATSPSGRSVIVEDWFSTFPLPICDSNSKPRLNDSDSVVSAEITPTTTQTTNSQAF